MREQEIQNEILRAFGTRSDLRLIRMNVGVAVPMSTVKAAQRALETGRIVKAAHILRNARPVTFGVPGMADLTGIISPTGQRLEIEVKTLVGRQSKVQKNYEIMINNMGGKYILARSVGDVLEALNSD